MSNCEYVFQSNCDDLVSPDSIEKQIKCLDEGADICYFDYYITDGYFRTWSEAVANHYTNYNTPDNGYSTGFGLGMFPMWKKSLHNDVGLFDERLEIYGDSLFWHKLKESDKKFKRIPEYLGVYAQRKGYNLESNQEFADGDAKILSTD
jgi:GT2 family glycosyltransferase